MVVTNDAALAEKVRMLRHGGQKSRYDHQLVGVNSRLDELQAAVLRVKLGYLDKWNGRRRHIAALYTALLGDSEVETPDEMPYGDHVFHLFVVRCRDRESLQRHLANQGVETAIHYPVPIHLQKAYRSLGLGPGSFPIGEAYSREALSLPLYPELTDTKVRQIAEQICCWRPRTDK